jgi:diguanylate cyclase (GGDEF)-like protein/PAS domain S-box-containing protein
VADVSCPYSAERVEGLFSEVRFTLESRWVSVFPPTERGRTAQSIIHDTALMTSANKNSFHARLLDALGQAVIATDPLGKVLYWNRAAESLYGWSAEEAMGRSIMEVTPSEDLVERAEEIMSELKSGKSWTGEFTVRRKDGTTFPALVTDTPVHDEQGDLVAVIGVSTDVTEIRRTEELRRSEERFRLLVEGVKDYAIFMLDPEGCISSWNAGAQRIKGYQAEEIVGLHFSVFYLPEDIERGHPGEELRLAQERGRYEEEGLRVRKDGSRFWASVLITAIRDEAGKLRGFSKVVRDITEHKRLEERLEYQAFHDLLTGLPNRHLFMDRLGQTLRRTNRRHKREVAILFIDLDNFKVVNDSLGHDLGDALLVAVVERLRNSLRPEDTLARFGGDEFIVLVEDYKSPEDVVRLAERLVEALREPFVIDERELFVGLSIGVAMGGADTKSPKELLRDADVAMYRAKDEAADYRLFDPGMYGRIMERLELENDLRRALEKEQFTLHYQPKFRLGQQQDTIEEVEALVRWEHPQRGFMLPGRFIPIAEATGLIIPIGGWVMKEACRQAKKWQERYPSEALGAVCVNLSPAQVRHPGLLQDVRSALRESGLAPGSLILEITEGTLLKDTQVIETIFGDLKALGVKVAIDDFGKKYSSLAYLNRLPVDGLKIDRFFLKDVRENPANKIIVEAVVSLAHSLGLEVTGEGVESAEQLEILRGMGCDLAQGYYLASPLPREEVGPLVANQPVY